MASISRVERGNCNAGKIESPVALRSATGLQNNDEVIHEFILPTTEPVISVTGSGEVEELHKEIKSPIVDAETTEPILLG